MIFNEKDDVAFLQFLANGYGEMLKDISPKKYSFFQRDKERDIAIISLILGTGLRVFEVASLTLYLV
ncbi:hypothetical protein COJ10_24480 [Bacillus thuringiensis]|nr:hypothetical protein COJ10_24480 [Bacillus thuringiensis]